MKNCTCHRAAKITPDVEAALQGLQLPGVAQLDLAGLPSPSAAVDAGEGCLRRERERAQSRGRRR